MRLAVLALLVACGGSSPKPHGDGMPHRFERAEDWATAFDDPSRDAWQQPDKVIASLELSPSMIVADVGAGTGYFSVRLAPLVKEVIAVDVEPDMVRYIDERAVRENHKNIRAVTSPPDDPKLANVDRIIVVNTWHHLGDHDAYAKKLAAALVPGGMLAVVDFKLDARRGPPREHRIPPDAVVAALTAAGLETTVSLELPEQYIVYGRKR